MTFIHRDPVEDHDNHYSILFNKIPQDSRLSLSAKGLHWYLVTRAPGYKFSKIRLLKELTAEKVVTKVNKDTKEIISTRTMRKDSRCSIESAFDELVDAGYIVNEKGNWHVYETSRLAENQQTSKISKTTDAGNQQEDMLKINNSRAENQQVDCRKSTGFTSVVRNVSKEGDKEGDKESSLSSSSFSCTEGKGIEASSEPSNDEVCDSSNGRQDQRGCSKLDKREQHEQASFLRDSRQYLRSYLGQDKMLPDVDLLKLWDQAVHILNEYPTPSEYKPNRKQMDELIRRVMYIVCLHGYELILATVQSYYGKKWPCYWFYEDDKDNYTVHLDEGQRLLDEKQEQERPVEVLTPEQIAANEAQQEAERQAEETKKQEIIRKNEELHAEQARVHKIYSHSANTNRDHEELSEEEQTKLQALNDQKHKEWQAAFNKRHQRVRTPEEEKKHQENLAFLTS